MTMQEPSFLYAKDVMRLLSVQETSAYNIIKRLNSELDSQGFYTIRGRVSTKYFCERFNIKTI